MLSALPPKPDVGRCGQHFAFVPKTDSRTAAKRTYSSSQKTSGLQSRLRKKVMSIRQAEPPKIFCHPVQNGVWKDHRLFEFCNREVGIETHQLHESLFSLLDPARRNQRSR